MSTVESTTPRRGVPREHTWSALARARRERTILRNRIRKVTERYERELAQAKAQLAKADASVRYHEELAQVDAKSAVGS